MDVVANFCCLLSSLSSYVAYQSSFEAFHRSNFDYRLALAQSSFRLHYFYWMDFIRCYPRYSVSLLRFYPKMRPFLPRTSSIRCLDFTE